MSGIEPMPLLLWPGLAADERLFEPQLRAFPSARVPAWITPERGEPLEAYAGRIAATLEVPRRSYAVGGFSFGGQVALELAGRLRPSPRVVILICGVRGRHQILPGFVAQQRLGSVIPASIQRRLYGPFARAFAARERLGPDQTRTLEAMARDNDPDFLRWSARACARWEGRPRLIPADAPPGTPPIPVRHIHGERDRVIPDVRREADVTIPGAGHLITWTHPEAVNEFVASRLRDAQDR